jgi:hypothetical protein
VFILGGFAGSLPFYIKMDIVENRLELWKREALKEIRDLINLKIQDAS